MSNDYAAYHLTVHVDLRATQLEDFIEHADNHYRIIEGCADLGLLDSVAGGWNREDWKPFPHEKNTNITQQNRRFESDAGDTYILFAVVKRGNVSCLWHAYYPRQGFLPGVRPGARGKSDFRVTATHYRRDRLNIAVWESPNIEPVLGDYLLEWLKQYWEHEDGVVDLIAKGAPSPDPPKPSEDELRWAETVTQAEASGNVSEYLNARRIARSTYYLWKKRLGK